MHENRQRAQDLLRQWRGDAYAFGLDCTDRLGPLTAQLGRRASVVVSGLGREWAAPLHAAVRQSLEAAGIEAAGDWIAGAAPNSPVADVHRLAAALAEQDAEVVVAVGGGSGLDAVKAALALHAAGGSRRLEDLFGVGQVTAALQQASARLKPLVACEIAASSASHLTKYANVTNLQAAQKMLIVDEAVVPPRAVFDTRWTVTMSPQFTRDGALDGVSHCWEVWMGARGETLRRVEEVARTGIELIVTHLKAAIADGSDLAAREALALGTDLGGLAIMIGGTNGGHLTSFSLVDLLPHGRACALMNPYYTAFFAPAIENKLRAAAAIYRNAGYLRRDTDGLDARGLGRAVAEAMLALSQDIGFPTTLSQVPGFQPAVLERALSAAKDPKLSSKLANMPVPLTAAQVDVHMRSVLEAAVEGDFERIRPLS